MVAVSHNRTSLSTTANSLGHQLSHTAQLDGHFRKCQAEYEAMARAVGIQPGWHILDAGCGTGVFLPLLHELVGPTGKVTAIDIAPENRQSAQMLVDAIQIGQNISIQEGDITRLPFADNMFDAIWCANVAQYLRDEQFGSMLQEFHRTLKPGGRLGIKEFDATTMQFLPADPELMLRLSAARVSADDVQAWGTLRSLLARSWLLKYGFTDVWIKNFVSDCQPPLEDWLIEYLGGFLKWIANRAETVNISATDLVAWR
ncbi:MAG: methyltransferase domain-containing protein, partial [Caldilineaceae bacterium]|nr:methyltransferase domain-containing protein [Caldilineaceae bacterium]